MNMTNANYRSSLTRDIILKRLQTIYRQAKRDRKWNVALQAVIMQGRQINMFVRQTLPVIARIKDMTEEQLIDFIAYLEENDPDLREPEIAPAAPEIDKPQSHPASVHPPPSSNGWLEEHSANNLFE
jgi:hypothetical protein